MRQLETIVLRQQSNVNAVAIRVHRDIIHGQVVATGDEDGKCPP